MATYTIASGDTLGGIAAKNKTTVANLMSLNPTIKDPNKIYAGGALNLGDPAPLTSAPALATPPKAPSTTMVASDIQSNATTSASTLPPPPAPMSYAPTLASIPTIESIVAPAKPSAAETEQTGIMSSLKGLYEKMLGKTSAQGAAEDAAGLPGYNSQLNDVNAQIKQLQAESSSATIRAEDRLAPTFAIAGEQTRIEHERTIKALGLSSISSALQGNIALAQQQADRAVEIQFGPIQEQIDYQQKLLDLNKETLSREDKKAVVLQQAQLDERKRLLDNAKEDKGIIIGWAAEASKNGASSYVVNQALAETDTSKALGILSGFLTDPNAKAKALAELDQTRAQTGYIQAQTKKLNEKPVDSTSGSFQEINGRTVLVNPKTGDIIKDYGEKGLTATEKKDELAKVENANTQIPVIQSKIALLDKLIPAVSNSGAVGTNPLGRTSLTSWFTGTRQDFVGGIKELTSQETLDKLLELKKGGGTLGALSDQERIMLQNAATKIGAWEIKDSSGNGTGFYNVSESTFQEELQKIKDRSQSFLDELNKTVGASSTNTTTTKSGKPFDMAAAKAAGYTDAEIQAYLSAN